MSTYRENYIVKAKAENSEINSAIYIDAKYIQLCVSLIILAILSVYFYSEKLGNWIKPTIFAILSILAILGAYSYTNTWQVITKNGKLYIRRIFSEKVIDYSCLVNVEVDYEIVTSDNPNSRPHKRYFLAIKYVHYKKEKIKTIKLQLKEETLPEAEKFCRMFMTNKQAEKRYDECFLDVREENSLPDRVIKKYIQKEIEMEKVEPKLKVIVVIIALIIFFMMMASIPIIENMQK